MKISYISSLLAAALPTFAQVEPLPSSDGESGPSPDGDIRPSPGGDVDPSKGPT
jgi:hypothetical protein